MKSAAIDPNLNGYGRDFDVVQLARNYPTVRFSTLSPLPSRPAIFDTFDAAMQFLPNRLAHTAAEPQARHAADHPSPLTARQTDVLGLLREGRSTKEIARRLGLAVPTVKTHLAALYRQLGARNRVEAVMKAVAPPAVRRAPRVAITDPHLPLRAPLPTA